MASLRQRSDNGDRGLVASDASRLRLYTIVRLRWVALLGQLATIGIVRGVLGFELPIGPCLSVIALSAWINVYLSIRYPARFRLSNAFASVILGYDILQLSALLYLTGGIENPFAVLLVAPVTISAATLPPLHTIVLGLFAAASSIVLAELHMPLPWDAYSSITLPIVYKVGIVSAIIACMTFLALYAWRLSKESRQMATALAATEHVLSREQRIHALDGLAAAAAHELGTPLATIVMTTKEMLRETPAESPMAEDLALLNSQAQRCREILQKLTRQPDAQDPMHAHVTMRDMIEEAARPHHSMFIPIEVVARPEPDTPASAQREPLGERRPGVIFGLANIIENAVDFARNKVEITAEWSADEITITIADDGPGFAPEIFDNLGDPYVTSRPSTRQKTDSSSGLGLGFFIAKSLIERSGATLTFENRHPPFHGAIVHISWPRNAFEPRRTQTWLPERRTTSPA